MIKAVLLSESMRARNAMKKKAYGELRRVGARGRDHKAYTGVMSMQSEYSTPVSSRAEKMHQLACSLEELAESGRIAVAFSAGIDSAFLLVYAHKVLGDRVAACTALSPFLPQVEASSARQFCCEHSIEWHGVTVDVLAQEHIADNSRERCYYCKKLIFATITQAARRQGYDTVIDGTNFDDMSDYRPGVRALEELGVRSPLKEACFTKEEVRCAAREMGISFWDKPASACLATRFAVGLPLRKEHLRAVEQAEEMLHDAGFVQCRVRVHGNDLSLARIEVMPDQIEKLALSPVRDRVVKLLRRLGFASVALDLQGYRRGSMNGYHGGTA